MTESLTSNEHAESLRTAAKRLYGVCDYQNSSTCEEAADELDLLHAKLDRAEQIMSAAYQLAGLVGAPVRFLDALSRQEGDIENLCPVTLDECDEFRRTVEPPSPSSKEPRWIVATGPYDYHATIARGERALECAFLLHVFGEVPKALTPEMEQELEHLRNPDNWSEDGDVLVSYERRFEDGWLKILRIPDEPTSARASNEQLAQALRNLRDVAHREVSPRYSAALDEAFTLADIALGEFDSEGDVSREADVGPGGGVRATHATGSAPSKPGAAEPPSAGVKCTHCNGKGYNEPIYDEQDGWTDETPCETCNGSGRITTVEQYLKTLPANWHEDSSLETWFPITAEELKRLKDERASQPPSGWHPIETAPTLGKTAGQEK